MKKYSCVIIEDEKPSIDLLQVLINEYVEPKLDILGTARDYESGFQLINNKKPDIVFMDIEMPKGSGFDLLERFQEPKFEVIVTTGFEKYAVNAFKFSAMDFLLKPIDHDRLQSSIKKCVDKLEKDGFKEDRIMSLLENLKNPNSQENKIPLPVLNGFQMVRIADISYCKSYEDYCYVYFRNEPKHAIVTKSIKEFEDILEDYNFFRVHNSFLVNKESIIQYIKGEGGTVILEDGTELPVSRRRKLPFLDWINS